MAEKDMLLVRKDAHTTKHRRIASIFSNDLKVAAFYFYKLWGRRF